MKKLALAIAALFALNCTTFAQQAQNKQKGAPKGPPAPPLMGCGVHGDIEILCGARSPEDIEATPDGKFLIVPQFAGAGRGGGPGGAQATPAVMEIFDIAKKTYSKLPVTNEPRREGKDAWGDASCPGPVGDALVGHGISLAKRNGGVWELYVVNHGGMRQSMEMFELKQTGGAWGLIWHGCVVSPRDFNDVAALADGSFIATYPTALQTPGMDLFTGSPSGYVVKWTAAKGIQEIPGTRVGYPNGVLVSSDGRYMYLNAWTAKEVHKYDLKEGKELKVVKLDFMPDNVTWTPKRQILAAGVKGSRGDCPAGSGTPCNQTFGIAQIDPATMAVKTVFDSQGKGALISGVSVAYETGGSIYIGAFSGDRLVKIPAPK